MQPLIRIDGGVKVSVTGCSFADIDGSKPVQYSCAEDKARFWGRHGQIVDIKGVSDTYITDCVFRNPSAREAVWIMPNSRDLSEINAHVNSICFYGCKGETPLNMLCRIAEINNLFFDSTCVFDGSAVNAFGENVVSDGIICHGSYTSVLDCMEWGLFRNDSVIVSNMNVVSPAAVAVASVADKVVLTHMTLSCSCAFASFNVVRDMSRKPYFWGEDFFPWKKTVLNRPKVLISDVNMTSYAGLYPPVLMNASSGVSYAGHVSLQNCEIRIVEPNPTYSSIMLFCAGLSMENCRISGLSNVYHIPKEHAYIGYVSSRSSVRENNIVINNCTFENTSGCAHVVAKVYGFINSFSAASNKCVGRFAKIVSGFFSTSVLCRDNYRTTWTEYPDAQIGFGRFVTDYPVALGIRHRGDMNVGFNNTLRYRHAACVKYNRDASESVMVRAGDIFKLNDCYLCVARSTNKGLFNLSGHTVPDNLKAGDIVAIDNVEMVVIAAEACLDSEYNNVDPQGEITDSYMGYTC